MKREHLSRDLREIWERGMYIAGGRVPQAEEIASTKSCRESVLEDLRNCEDCVWIGQTGRKLKVSLKR